MGVSDDRWSALQARYGDPSDPMSKTMTDLLWEWRVDLGLEGGDETRDYIMGLYPDLDSYTDAEAAYWAEVASYGVLWGAELFIDARYPVGMVS